MYNTFAMPSYIYVVKRIFMWNKKIVKNISNFHWPKTKFSVTYIYRRKKVKSLYIDVRGLICWMKIFDNCHLASLDNKKCCHLHPGGQY